MRYLSTTVVLIIILLSLGCKGEPTNTAIPIYNLAPNTQQTDQQQSPTGAILASISIEPGATNIQLGGKQIFKAYGRYSNDAVIDITGFVTWYSTNPSVGVIDDKGVFTSTGEGWAGIGAYNMTSGEGAQIIYSPYAFANVFAAGEQPPAPVRNVKAALFGNVVGVIWEYSNEPNIKGYNVYRTRVSGQDYDVDTPINDKLITLNHFTDPNPGSGILYYVVAAVNEDDVVGAFSQEAVLDFFPNPDWADWQP